MARPVPRVSVNFGKPETTSLPRVPTHRSWKTELGWYNILEREAMVHQNPRDLFLYSWIRVSRFLSFRKVEEKEKSKVFWAQVTYISSKDVYESPCVPLKILSCFSPLLHCHLGYNDAAVKNYKQEDVWGHHAIKSPRDLHFPKPFNLSRRRKTSIFSSWVTP